MRIRVSNSDLNASKAELAICFAYHGAKAPEGIRDAKLKRELAAQIKAERFQGRRSDQLLWSSNGRFPARRFLILGLGKRSKSDDQTFRSAAARASRAATKLGAGSIALALPDGKKVDADELGRAVAEGLIHGNYHYDKYLTDADRRPPAVKSAELCGGAAKAALQRGLRRGEKTAGGVQLARDCVNEPPSSLTPTAMANIAKREAKRVGLSCRVLSKPELTKLGMKALLNVSRGSAAPPKVVHLVYKPKSKRGAKKIVLVGKGVTFDSGGLNLKPSSAMFTMKCDMGGSAAVLGAIVGLAELGCKHEVHAILGLVENMTGADSYKPGDILESYSGKTIEVGNTDAEGRLVLCDLLAWAAKTLKPDCMVDVATLTGAVVVALGTEASGLFTRHDEMRDGLLAGAAAAGEKWWPMPMYDEYLSLLQHGPADLHNIGGRWGGAITAALFLGEFVPRDMPWAHVDIAGPAFAESDTPERHDGGTGAGAAGLIRWLESY